MRNLCKRLMPVLLIVVLVAGMFPASAMAASPDISIEPSSGTDGGTSNPTHSSTPASSAPASGTGPDISIEPSEGSSTPGSSMPSSSAPVESTSPKNGGDVSSDLEITPDGEETSEPPTGLDGAPVIMESGGMAARGMLQAQATGTLHITKVDAYQWDFGFSHGGSEMRPWYIMDIDGKIAYCVEPTNPSTNPGNYQTLDYNGLSGTQRLAIGTAMLYGAQDASNPLFHMATQTVIWEISLGYMDITTLTTMNKSAYNATIGYNPGAATYYDSIITNMRSHMQVPSFARFVEVFAPLHTVPGIAGEYKLDLVNTNPNADLGQFTFANTGTVRFVKEGQTLHVTSTGPLDGNTTYMGVKGSMDALNSVIFWGSGADQIRATGHCDPVPGYFRLITNNIGQYQITVIKLEAGTNSPLAGAEFQVRHSEKGVVGNYTTDGSGRLTVSVPWQGTYIISEVTPPKNHLLDENPVKDIVISTEHPSATVTFHNKSFSGLQITKVDGTTKARIPGVTFRVAAQGGGQSQDVVTGSSGIAFLPNLVPNVYTVQEISCPPGFILDSQVRIVEIKDGEVCEITIENFAKPSLEIRKVDADTGAPLAGATFRIARRGSLEFQDIVSGKDGIARLTGMVPDYFTVTEIATAEGYILDGRPQTVEIVAGKVTTITIQNSRKPSLEILKIDSITKQPLQYATFRIGYKNGETIGNFTSDVDGRVLLEGIDPGLLVIEEISSAAGYIVDNTPQEVLLKAGETKTVTFENTPKSPVIIKKIDSVSGEPLEGAKFRVTKMNGELIGEFTSGRYGFITVPGLEPGWFTVVELQSAPGYKVDSTPKNVEVKRGQPAVVEFENTPLPGLLLQKVDAVTGLGMAGVEFEVTKLSGEKVGTFTTGEGGHIFIENLTDKHIMVKETKTLPGYKIDTAEVMVTLETGKLNRVVFTNSPWPYLVIVKIDAETKVPIPDTEFRLMDTAGKEIGTYKTNAQGKIVLTGIDAGAYKLQETKAAPAYVLDDTVWDIVLEWGKTTTVTFKNLPLEIDVTVEKRGPVEAIAGQEIRYDFSNIANHSSVALEDYFWHDLLPTDAVRLVSIQTGTWGYVNPAEKGKPNPTPLYSETLYSVVYRTNLKDNWVVLAENLSPKVDHELVCSAQVLGLASNEYVAEFKFLFGTAKPGFHEIHAPFITCRVLADLPSEYQFTNRTDVGGRYGGKWTYDKDSWTTVVYKTPDKGKLPKTGAWV